MTLDRSQAFARGPGRLGTKATRITLEPSHLMGLALLGLELCGARGPFLLPSWFLLELGCLSRANPTIRSWEKETSGWQLEGNSAQNQLDPEPPPFRT